MKIVGVSSIKGGAGATTIVAHLGAALTLKNIPVFLVDLCPTNQIRLHLGGDFADQDGLVADLSEAMSLQDKVCKNSDGIIFMPHGLAGDSDIDLSLISRLLQECHLPDDSFVLFDCPTNDRRIFDSIYEISDQFLLVVNAEPASYARLHDSNLPLEKTSYVVNRFNPLSTLEGDFFEILRADHPNYVLPFTIHSDEAVREALAHKKTVFCHEENSQAGRDYSLLADWLDNRTGGE